MKEIYILLLLLATIPIKLFSQQDIVIVKDSTYTYYWYENDWALFNRIIYSYDANGNKTEEIWYRWNQVLWTGQWENAPVHCGGSGRECTGGRHHYSYNQQGELTALTMYNWDSGTNAWVEYRRETYTYTYEASNHTITYMVYSRDPGTGEWYGDFYETKTYDANGNLIDFLIYHWDSGTSDWIVNWHQINIYDTIGNNTESAEYKWDSGINDWVGWRSRTSAYDVNGNETESFFYRWDSETNDWVVSSRRTFNYRSDTSGYITEGIWHSWNPETSDWIKKDSSVTVEDANGNLIEHFSFDWDSETGDWNGDLHSAYTYDDHGNMSEEISYYWDSEINGWVVFRHSTFTYTYDSNENELEYIWNEWALEYNDWRFISKKVSYWSELTTFISNNITDLNYIVYPNPTQGMLTIETGIIGQYSINITSLNGKLMYNSKVAGPTHQIDLSSFEKGLYFIMIRSRDYVRMEKIIKQ